jgi:uncharacterized protein YdaU (DUF1376 family)
MSDRAWMPLDIDDYMADTLHLSAAEHGAYMLLIMRYWKDGGLPTDERMIQRYSRLSAEQWAESRDVIAAFFGEGWSHKRIDAELAKATAIIEKRRNAANARHAGRKSDASAEQVQSKCTDTGVPPSTNNLSSSLRSDEPRDALKREFDEFWSEFPHKVGKPKALAAFTAARKRASLEAIMAGLRRYVAGKPPDRSWLNPATFLNQDRWGDEPAAVARAGPPHRPPSVQEILKARRQEPSNHDDRPPNRPLLVASR